MLERHKWCQRVCEQVRFWPDHESIKKKLEAHMEDCCELLTASGLEKEAAETAMLERMGDPAEVGRALNRVHKPWLGWLWKISRWLVIAAVVIALWSVLTASSNLDLNEGKVIWWAAEDECSQQTSYGQHHHHLVLDPKCWDESDGFVFTVPAAELCVCDSWYAQGQEMEGTTQLKLALRATQGLPLTSGCDAFSEFYMVDDRGNTYSWPYFWQKQIRSSLWSSECQIWVDGFDPEAQWVELRYDRAGRDIALRIGLTGGERE